ncbi:hypothetical protein [Sphingobacterium siyangense]|uniref:hypothetical protein n=1 Tax=Sphingobacterium siyangense TaxID=459529 RepID=UPI003DA4A526
MSLLLGRLFRLGWVLINIIFMVLGAYFPEFMTSVLVLATLTNFFLIICLKNIQPAMIMALFFISYLLFLFPYYFLGYRIVVYTDYYEPALFDKALIIHSIFLNSFFLFLRPNINIQRFKLIDLVPTRPNKYFFWGLAVLLILIVVTMKGQSVVGDGENSYEAYMENLEGQGGILEYFYLLFIVGFFFASNVHHRKILMGIAIAYCLQCIVRGYRIQMVQMGLLTFLLFFDNYFKLWKIVGLCILGVLISEIISVLKMTGGIDYETLVKGVDFAKEGEVLIVNQTDVFYSSVTFLGLIQDGILDFWTRFYSMLGFILNWFVPSSFVWQEARLPSFSKNYTDLGGGGLVSIYIYVWFGYLGVVALGFILAKGINYVFKDGGRSILKIVLIIILSVYPRWFAYDPGNFLFRFSIYLLGLYFILYEIVNYLKKDVDGENINS